MGLVDGALNVLAANMAGSSLSTNTAIGIGSLAFSGNQTGLDSQSDSNLIVSTDLSTTEQVTFISNYSPIEMSGTVLQEFGTFTSGGTMLDRQVLTGSLVFDGEQELQVQETFKFFVSGT